MTAELTPTSPKEKLASPVDCYLAGAALLSVMYETESKAPVVVPPITDWGPTHNRDDYQLCDETPEDLTFSA